MNEVLEFVMLFCFGLSWPINAYKHWKAGTAKSTSVYFILLILFGYVAGITAKLLVPPKHFYVLLIYFINFFNVSLDLVIYFVNRRKDRAAQQGSDGR